MLKWFLCDFLAIHRTDVSIQEPAAKEDGVHFGVTIHCARCGKVSNKVEWRFSIGGPAKMPTTSYQVRGEDLGLN